LYIQLNRLFNANVLAWNASSSNYQSILEFGNDKNIKTSNWELFEKYQQQKTSATKRNNNNWPVREIRVNRFWQIPSPTRSRCHPLASAWLWRSCWSVRAGKQNQNQFLIHFNPRFKKFKPWTKKTKKLFNPSLKTKQKSFVFISSTKSKLISPL
jgi:hypothetical protein